MTDQEISINIRLPLKIQLLDSPFDSEFYDINNLPIIQLHEVLEHQNSCLNKPVVHNAAFHNQTELSRIESKIDLLMMLYSRSQLTNKLNKISEYNVNLSFDHIKIEILQNNNIDKYERDQCVALEVFFNKSSPEPILLTGQVNRNSILNVLDVEFFELGQITKTFIEKFIFKQHRTEVALLRKREILQ